MLKLTIVGALGKDAIVKEVGGKTVINFSVAHGEKWKDAQGNLKEKTTWVEVAYWTDKTAVAQYLKKGQWVACEGQPEADAYKDNSGDAKATLRLRVQSLQLVGSAGAQQQPSPNPEHKTQSTATPASSVDELPF